MPKSHSQGDPLRGGGPKRRPLGVETPENFWVATVTVEVAGCEPSSVTEAGAKVHVESLAVFWQVRATVSANPLIDETVTV